MYKRKIYNELLKWKSNNEKSNKHKALIIKGARQVGKTTIVQEFAQKEYENVVYINFMYDVECKTPFEGDLHVDKIISQLKVINSSFNFVPNKTLIIFDEIQECARARSSIKPFCLDGRFDIVATGSLLGVMGYNRNKNASIPVGFEKHLTMYAMDFEEFMLAIGYDNELIGYLKDRVQRILPIDTAIHNKLIEDFKWYMLVGGMPEAVEQYVLTKDINLIRDVQQSIIDSYRSDFGKHLDSNEESVINNFDYAKLSRLYESIPNQIARPENFEDEDVSNKFKFSEVQSGTKFRDYAEAIQWLKDAGIVYVCHNLKTISQPLQAYSLENYFKIYMNDSGLLFNRLPNKVAQDISFKTFGTYKGYVYENVVADQLYKNGLDLYFMGDSRQELDFVVSGKDKIFVIEVKSSLKSKTYSLNCFNQSNQNKDIKLIKLSQNNIGFIDGKLTLPYYLAFLIDEDFEYPIK